MKFIIPILVGATIGYITNWLAIKMLFKPYEEKKFLGFHVPLTPGLIPKERERIANSIGQTVGNYLLSPEVVIKYLSSNKAEQYIRGWIETKIYKLKEDNRPLKAFISQLNEEDNLLNALKSKLSDIFYNEIRKDQFKIRFLDFLRYNLFNSSMERLFSLGYDNLDKILFRLSELEEGQKLLNNFILEALEQLALDKRKLSEVVSEDFIFAIKDFIKNHKENIRKILKDVLNDEEREKEIKNIINRAVSKNMNKLIIMFISPEIISDKVYNMIREYVDAPEVSDNIINIIYNLIDKLMETKVETIFKEIKIQVKEEEVSNISNKILEYLSSEKNRKKIIEGINEMLTSHEIEIQNALWSQLSSIVEEILESDTIYDNIYLIVDNFVDDFMNRPVSSLVEKIYSFQINRIANLSIKTLNYFIENKLPYLVKLFNISKIVEDQINSYDVAFVEELIFEIAHKELKAITWLGALLGGIMGLLSPLLQMIN